MILYGHNMRSGKMFAALTKYKEKSFYEAHRYIVFETLNGVHIYEVMFVLTTPVYTGNTALLTLPTHRRSMRISPPALRAPYTIPA